MRWNLLHHLEAHTSEYDLNYDSCFNEHLLSELDTTENPVDARKIYVRLSFSSKTSLVEARLIIEANKTSPNVRNRLLMALEFHTIEGRNFQVFFLFLTIAWLYRPLCHTLSTEYLVFIKYTIANVHRQAKPVVFNRPQSSGIHRCVVSE